MTPGSLTYVVTTAVGLAATAVVWRIAAPKRDGRVDPRMLAVYAGALAGAYAGAKVAFLVAEGWHVRDDWAALLSGHSVTGGLVGGVLGVETAKHVVGLREGTGDLFALTVPLALAIGRIGCIAAGCCLGVECEPSWWTATDVHGHARWPAAGAELAFNLAFWAWAIVATRRGWIPGQRFNAYLIAYGCFRFAHEFVRDDARWWGPLGGYHLVALAIVATGMVLWRRRARLTPSPAASRPSPSGPPQSAASRS
ncbi:MAG: prolipoprotein diacylglyceryl transferase family protein [Phycisphaerales bacterium]